MRPKEVEIDSELYECPVCNARFESPETRTCDECGGPLRNLSNGRDL